MDRPAKPVRIVPENALVHFALSQRQHGAALAALSYFVRRLQDPRERELASDAYRAMSVITHFSLPSEERDASDEVIAQADTPKGIEALRGGKK